MTTSIQKTLEVLNDSKITGHISGRHLIQVHQREDNNDENEYEYLDEWLQRKLSQALTEQHEADVQSFREMVEQYFKGLIAITDPQATKVSLLASLDETKNI
jgi:phosphoglycolate phosphatase-like HAD superfamily hydrolase